MLLTLFRSQNIPKLENIFRFLDNQSNRGSKKMIRMTGWLMLWQFQI